MKEIKQSLKHVEKLIKAHYKRAKKMEKQNKNIDLSQKETIKIGVLGGDGIGPIITQGGYRVIEYLLEDEIKRGKVKLINIEGLTIENRLKERSPIPKEVLKEIKECDVILKGPTTTPSMKDKSENIESANVALRKELDLYANIRPVKVKSEGIDWTFFRENTEGGYALGSSGISINDKLFVDFTVTTKEGSKRIAKKAFEYARANNKKRVSIITKANVIKTTDGVFLKECYKVSKNYKDIEVDDWYVDIMSAKLIDKKRRNEFEVFVLPNLYGDILTDEAAQFQGGVGTAGSANIGDKYAMFEAIHGSAPRMVEEKRDKYADPSSILRATVMLLNHINYNDKATLLEDTLDDLQKNSKVKITGKEDGATAEEFIDYLIETLKEQSK